MITRQPDSIQELFNETLGKFQEFNGIYTKIYPYLNLSNDKQQYFQDKINYWIYQLEKPEFPIAF
ncbi:MAG: hypothetical protein ACKO5Q_02200, partial [Microcystaceae cyanobacterium]